uniref:G_PROTEIN_RECEP_F1_2 domain-containing protein n=1 Tax=Schistosoma mansoni TaxID=6183 RepID=A0A5K4F2A2_SCHMA
MIIIGIFLTICSICTFIGNLLVVLAIGLVKKLRTPSNFLIVSLAVSDLLVGLLVQPLATLRELYGYWPFGEGMCDMFISFDVLMCTASILNLCAISIDRYLAITRPLRYAAKRTPKRMMIMILLVWLFSALISIPPMFGFKEPFVTGLCEYSSNIIYQIYATCGAFYIPLIVMLILYGRILILARNMAHADAKQQRVAESVTQTNAHSSLESEPPEQLKFEHMQKLKQAAATTTTTNMVENKSDVLLPLNNEQNNSVYSSNNSTKEKYPLPPSELCRRRKPRPLRRLSYGDELLIKKLVDINVKNVRKPTGTSECSSTMSSIEQFEQHVKELKQLRTEFFAAPYTRHSITISVTQLKNRNDHKEDENFSSLNTYTFNNIHDNNGSLQQQEQPVTLVPKNKPLLLTDSNRSRNSIFSPPLLSVSHYFDESSYMNSLTQISEVAPNPYTSNDNHRDDNKNNLEEYSSNLMLISQETTPLIVNSTDMPFTTGISDIKRDFYYSSSFGTPLIGPKSTTMHPARPRQRPFHTPRRSFTAANEYIPINRPFILDLPNYAIDRRCSSPSTSHYFPWNHIINRNIRKDAQNSLGLFTNTRTTTTTTTITNDNENAMTTNDNHNNTGKVNHINVYQMSFSSNQTENYIMVNQPGSLVGSNWVCPKLPPVKKRNSRHQNESKAVKTLGIIMGCFCLCWLPFFIIALVVPIHKVVSGKDLDVPDIVRSICLWLGYLNSTVNPVIYVIFNRDFRLPFREILLCRCRGMNARLRSQKYALEYGMATSNASQGGGGYTAGTVGVGFSGPGCGYSFSGPSLPNNENNNIISSITGITSVHSQGMNLCNKAKSQKNSHNNTMNTYQLERFKNHTNLGFKHSGQIDNLNLSTGRYTRHQSGSVSFNR